MEIRTYAELSVKVEVKEKDSIEPLSARMPIKLDAARYFIERMDFLRSWAAEYERGVSYAD